MLLVVRASVPVNVYLMATRFPAKKEQFVVQEDAVQVDSPSVIVHDRSLSILFVRSTAVNVSVMPAGTASALTTVKLLNVPESGTMKPLRALSVLCAEVK
jgi:hypothetical protein